MYVFPPQCLSPGLMKNAIWYIVGLLCDACENVKGISSKTKTWKCKKCVAHWQLFRPGWVCWRRRLPAGLQECVNTASHWVCWSKIDTFIRILLDVCQNVVQAECARGFQWPKWPPPLLPGCLIMALGSWHCQFDLWPATRLFGVPCVLYIIMPYQPVILCFLSLFLLVKYIYFLFCL